LWTWGKLRNNSKVVVLFTNNGCLVTIFFATEKEAMKEIMVLAFFLTLPSIAKGGVSTRVCLADGNTPLELADPNIPFLYRDIMVGTKLTIIVSSDVNGYWRGKLAITEPDCHYGLLSARNYNETTLDWAGSRFPTAGDRARVWDWQVPEVQGFKFQGHRSAVAGDWFIIDYTATNMGICSVRFYDGNVSWDEPVYYLTFFHVPTRDFNNNTVVDFVDFALFALYWRLADRTDPKLWVRVDLDSDGDIDFSDLMLFADYWLEKTE